MITDQSKEDFMMEFFFLIERLADARIYVLHKINFLFKDKIKSFFYILSLNSGFRNLKATQNHVLILTFLD